MTTAEAGNIHTIALEGTFRRRASLRLKTMFNHRTLRDENLIFAGVNSINLTRILFQDGCN